MVYGPSSMDFPSKTHPNSHRRICITTAIIRFAIHQPEIKVLYTYAQLSIVFKCRGREVINVQYFLQLKLPDERYFVEEKARKVLLDMALDIFGIGAVGIVVQQQKAVDSGMRK